MRAGDSFSPSLANRSDPTVLAREASTSTEKGMELQQHQADPKPGEAAAKPSE